jgi:hypothetical protein
VSRQYRNLTGTYAEEELAIVVWINPNRKKSNARNRALETMTAENSSYPMAFPLKAIAKHRSWKNALTANNTDELLSYLPASTRIKPIIVPLPIAQKSLGWDNFYIPSEYTN